jgi:hypothetical protein
VLRPLRPRLRLDTRPAEPERRLVPEHGRQQLLRPGAGGPRALPGAQAVHGRGALRLARTVHAPGKLASYFYTIYIYVGVGLYFCIRSTVTRVAFHLLTFSSFLFIFTSCTSTEPGPEPLQRRRLVLPLLAQQQPDVDGRHVRAQRPVRLRERMRLHTRPLQRLLVSETKCTFVF